MAREQQSAPKGEHRLGVERPNTKKHLGNVMETTSGRDVETRVVKVKMAYGTYLRPVSGLDAFFLRSYFKLVFPPSGFKQRELPSFPTIWRTADNDKITALSFRDIFYEDDKRFQSTDVSESPWCPFVLCSILSMLLQHSRIWWFRKNRQNCKKNNFDSFVQQLET